MSHSDLNYQVTPVYHICNLLLKGEQEMFTPCSFVNLEKDFPETSEAFERDEQTGRYVAKFKGREGLLAYLWANQSFSEEYKKLKWYQKFFLYFSIAPFGRSDMADFCKKVNLSGDIDDIVNDAVRVKAKEIGIPRIAIVGHMQGFGSMENKPSAMELAKKVAACLHI